MEAVLKRGDLRRLHGHVQAAAVAGNGNGGAVALAGIRVDEILRGHDDGAGGEVLVVLRGIELGETADLRVRPESQIVLHPHGEDMEAEGKRRDQGWRHLDIEAAAVSGDGNGGSVALAGIGVDVVFGLDNVRLDPAREADAGP